MEIPTGSADWRSWVRRTARADRLSGIPERRYPGFRDSVGRCGSSAGVAEYFLDLHHLEGRSDDLALAVTMVDDLLDRSMRDDTGIRWSNVEDRNAEPNLPPETTYLQGRPALGPPCSGCTDT